MNIHIAGAGSGGKDDRIVERSRWLLESYHYAKKDNRCISFYRKHGKKMFCDSGAYSAHTQGVSIDIDGYIDWTSRHMDVIHMIAALDVIGDPAASWDNFEYMIRKGVDAIPTYHFGEPFEYLLKMLDYPYIAIGGLVGAKRAQLQYWLDDIWDKYLIDGSGNPKVKVHGFGLTDSVLMFRYPWYSVDSTAWVLTSRFGSIFIDLPGAPNQKVIISSQSPQTKSLDKHYDTMAPYLREEIRKTVEAKGFHIDDLREKYWHRDMWNIEWFNDKCDVEIPPFKKLEMGLF